MKLFCHFQIKPQELINYTFDWKSSLAEDHPEFTILEADNHSEPFLIQQTSQLMIASEILIVFFDVLEDQNLGTLSKALEAIRQRKGNITVLLNGENQLINKSLKLLRQVPIRFEDAQQALNVINRSIQS